MFSFSLYVMKGMRNLQVFMYPRYNPSINFKDVSPLKFLSPYVMLWNTATCTSNHWPRSWRPSDTFSNDKCRKTCLGSALVNLLLCIWGDIFAFTKLLTCDYQILSAGRNCEKLAYSMYLNGQNLAAKWLLRFPMEISTPIIWRSNWFRTLHRLKVLEGWTSTGKYWRNI